MKNILIVVLLLTVWMVAQTSGPSQLAFSPLGASTGCVTSANGSVLCAASDGFYISVSGGSFQKVAVVTSAATQLTCTTATLATGSTGGLTASGCTLK
jgi:hypothetical protein